MKRYPLSAGIGITRSGSRSDWTSKPKLIVLVVCQIARSDFFFQDPNCENVQAIGRLSVPPTARTSQRPDWHSDTMDSGTQRINRTQCINASTFASVHVLLLRNLRFNWPKITLSCLPWQPKFYGNKQNHLHALPPCPAVIVSGSALFNLPFHLQPNNFEQCHSHLPDFDWAP